MTARPLPWKKNHSDNSRPQEAPQPAPVISTPVSATSLDEIRLDVAECPEDPAAFFLRIFFLMKAAEWKTFGLSCLSAH